MVGKGTQKVTVGWPKEHMNEWCGATCPSKKSGIQRPDLSYNVLPMPYALHALDSHCFKDKLKISEPAQDFKMLLAMGYNGDMCGVFSDLDSKPVPALPLSDLAQLLVSSGFLRSRKEARVSFHSNILEIKWNVVCTGYTIVICSAWPCTQNG